MGVTEGLGPSMLMEVLGSGMLMEVLGSGMLMEVLGSGMLMEVLGSGMLMEVLGSGVLIPLVGVMEGFGPGVLLGVMGTILELELLASGLGDSDTAEEVFCGEVVDVCSVVSEKVTTPTELLGSGDGVVWDGSIDVEGGILVNDTFCAEVIVVCASEGATNSMSINTRYFG